MKLPPLSARAGSLMTPPMPTHLRLPPLKLPQESVADESPLAELLNLIRRLSENSERKMYDGSLEKDPSVILGQTCCLQFVLRSILWMIEEMSSHSASSSSHFDSVRNEQAGAGLASIRRCIQETRLLSSEVCHRTANLTRQHVESSYQPLPSLNCSVPDAVSNKLPFAIASFQAQDDMHRPPMRLVYINDNAIRLFGIDAAGVARLRQDPRQLLFLLLRDSGPQDCYRALLKFWIGCLRWPRAFVHEITNFAGKKVSVSVTVGVQYAPPTLRVHIFLSQIA